MEMPTTMKKMTATITPTRMMLAPRTPG